MPDLSDSQETQNTEAGNASGEAQPEQTMQMAPGAQGAQPGATAQGARDAQPGAAAQDAQEGQPGAAARGAQEGQPPTEPPKKKRPLHRRPWFWVLLVVVFFIIVIIIGAAASSSESSSSGNYDSSSSGSYETATEDAGPSSPESSDPEAEPEPAESDEAPADAEEPVPENTRAPFTDTLAGLGDFEQVVLAGSGDDVVDLPCAGMPCLMDVSYVGERNFSVKLLNSAGESEDLLVNEIGEYFGTVTTYNDFANSAMLEIHASGDWSITVRPMSSMLPLENGAPYQGSNVLYIDVDDMSRLNITNAGEHNFVVRGVGLDRGDLLVNEIGDYSGTVAWNQGQCFLIVEDSYGTWSVSW